MAQAVKLIDLNRSYVPIDPNSFPESMHSTQQEDAPEGRIPVVPYDGYNFMPTAYGYMSYFGINSILDVDALTIPITPFTLLNVDDVFIVQTPDLRNILVALCEDGIYTKVASVSGAWTKVIDLTVTPFVLPPAGTHLNYTKCVIGNEVYIYRASSPNVWVMRAAENFVPTALNPSTNMNMAAQQGIFKAGGRLGMWDSANSIAWSDIDDKMDFIPDLETGASATIFQQIVGKIVVVMQHGNGFIIYCTRAIVHVQRQADANFFWRSETIFNDNGISYMGEATQGQPDTTHFAYTTFGIVKIQNGQSEYIIPEFFSYMKEKRDPVYLRLLEGRYLFFQFLNPSYLLGIPSFSQEGVPGSSFTFKGASYAVNHISENPCKALNAADNQHEGIYLFDTFGYTQPTQAVTPGQVPIWEDILGTAIPLATIKDWKAAYEAGNGVSYFSGVAFAQGSIPKITSGNEFMIPAAARSIPAVSGYAQTTFTEDNTQDFYAKQDMLWQYERYFQDYWIRALMEKVHTPVDKVGVYNAATDIPPNQTYSFGPFLDLSFLSESNKYYGLADKSAWLQRSLIKAFYIDVEVSYELTYQTPIVMTTASDYGGALPVPVTPADFLNDDLSGRGTVVSGISAPVGAGACNVFYYTNVDVNGVPSITYSNVGSPNYNPDGSPGTSPKCLIVTFAFKREDTGGNIDALMVGHGNGPGNGTGLDAPDVYGTLTQSFGRPKLRYVDYPICTHKELGHTHIKGHGHYTLAGNFVVDDATPEAADYIDQCNIPPAKSKTLLFNGVPVPSSIGQGCLEQEPVIDTVTFTYEDQTITLPPTSFLMQDGSIEPIYPIFQGAFVFDMHEKKWGKCGQAHRLLMNYSPINSQAGDKPIPADIFNVNAGCLLENNTIAIFDKYPADSMIKYGKIGYFRKGFTSCEEVRLQFRNLATGTITVEGSLDGKNIEPAFSQIRSYENVNEMFAYFSNSARWFNVIITGIYDLKNMDFNGHKQGKR